MKTRNLVILYDGTWADTSTNTNVKRIYQACSSKNQEFHYEEGVGTAHFEALPGGIFGANIDRQILSGYKFLRRRFRDSGIHRNQNKIFMFGFSRGAYAIRRLAGLVDFCGLPKKAKDIEKAWRIYLNQNKDAVSSLINEGLLFKVPIESLCVWDTVKTTADKDFNDKKLPACVVTGYHAMAIDEKRKFFPVLKWNNDSRVRQLWFAGVHGDVGGGLPDRGLSDITLNWMIDKTATNGLRFKASTVTALNPNPSGAIHDSYQGIWVPLGKKSRVISPTALVHDSVQTRIGSVEGYTPPNLPDDPNYVSA